MSSLSRLWHLQIVMPADENAHLLETDDVVFSLLFSGAEASP